MSELPWVVAPRRQTRIVSAVVNDQECSLELPVFGAWLADEEIAIREHEYQSAVYAESSRLADALVADGALEIDAQRIAVRVVSTRLGIPVALAADEQRALLHHATLVAEVQNRLAQASMEQTLRTVAAAISIRTDACQDWDEAMAVAGKFPGPLQQAIAGFMDEERHGGARKDPEELVAAMTEALGKLGPQAGDGQSPPTGPEPSGAAAASGPAIPLSAESVSAGSRPPSSAKRSRRASAG